MMSAATTLPLRTMAPARKKLLAAALTVIRTKGFEATTIDELCAAAGVAKGSFFHHFKSKEALGVAAAEYFSELSDALFAAAPYHAHEDPRDRILGYLDFRKALVTGKSVPEFTCLLGTMVQEVYETCPEIRAACDAGISGQAAKLEADIAEAMERYGARAGVTAQSLALHILAVLQGAFVMAKAKGNAGIAAENIEHLRRYVGFLFEGPPHGR